MTGINPIVFWGASFTWDFFVTTLLLCLMITCFPIFQKFGAFTVHGGAGEARLKINYFGILISLVGSIYK
jgi:hypothetical protein